MALSSECSPTLPPSSALVILRLSALLPERTNALPELPEVETVVRSVAGYIIGQPIEAVTLSSHRVTRGDRARTIQALVGSTISAVRRHGKQIRIELDRGLLYIHLGMTGNLLWNATPGKDSRAVFTLKNGLLVYNDIRQFGRVEFYPETPPHLARVGPDALQVDFPAFFAGLKKRKGPIKPLLLNQLVSGVGNIYADEALFAARIHPRTRAGASRSNALGNSTISCRLRWSSPFSTAAHRFRIMSTPAGTLVSSSRCTPSTASWPTAAWSVDHQSDVSCSASAERTTVRAASAPELAPAPEARR